MKESFPAAENQEASKPQITVNNGLAQETVAEMEADATQEKRVLDFLLKNNVLEERDGGLVLNRERIGDTDFGEIKRANAAKQANGRSLSIESIIDVAQGLSVYDSIGLDSEKDVVETRPMLKLPLTRESALRGDFDNEGLTEISDFTDRLGDMWTKKIRLADGSEFNLAELELMRRLAYLKTRRNENGSIEVFDEDSQRFSKLVNNQTIRKNGLNFQITRDGKTYKFSNSPVEFAHTFFSDLIEQGVLPQDDFRIGTGSSVAEIYRTHDRLLSPSSPYLTFSNNFGSAKYYIGRTKIVGTDIVIEPSMKARQLDSNTIGIVDTIQGKEKIIATFGLSDETEFGHLKEEAKAKLEERGKEATVSSISANCWVGAEAMVGRVKPYFVTDFIHRTQNESEKEYVERVVQLNDTRFASKTFQNFFSKAGIGTHQLPWKEQLVISGALLVERNTDRLLNFAKKFKLTGLRAFLSLEYGKGLGADILTIGEKLQEEDAQKIFDKYGEIVDSAEGVAQYLKEIFGNSQEYDQSLVDQIQEQLLKRAKDVLVQFAQSAGTTDAQNVERQLEKINTDVLLFTASFKTLKSQGQELRLEDINGVEMVSQNATALNTDDAGVMRQIYRENYSQYPKVRESLVKGFDESLKNPNTDYSVLRHNGKVVGYYRLDKRADGSLYFGSFNVDPQYRGSRLGETMLQESLDEKTEGQVVEADCNPATAIASNYIERGFVGYRSYLYGEIPSLSIVRNSEENSMFASKQMSQETIVAQAKIGQSVSLADGQIIISAEQFGFEGKMPPDSVITRYFKIKKDGKEITYTVFEKVNSAEFEKYRHH